jgi:hypothetical protein
VLFAGEGEDEMGGGVLLHSDQDVRVWWGWVLIQDSEGTFLVLDCCLPHPSPDGESTVQQRCVPAPPCATPLH